MATHRTAQQVQMAVTSLSLPWDWGQAEPLSCVPAQFYDGTPARNVPHGVRRLMVAVLEDAIRLLHRHRNATAPKRRRLHQEARRWVLSDDRSSLFAYLRVTEALGIDQRALRRRLLAQEAMATMPAVRRGRARRRQSA